MDAACGHRADYRLYHQAPFREAAGDEFRPGGLELTGELAAACALKAGELLLDLACGVGSTASFLADRFQADVCGLDASPEFIAEARRRDSGVRWVLGRAEAIPFPDDHFDVVFAECFLSGLDDQAAVLAEIRRVLRPEGRLALSDMCLRNPEAAALSAAPPCTCLGGAGPVEDTLAVLERAGFAILEWRDRSDALKALTASLILAYGSTASFLRAAGIRGDLEVQVEQLRAARPGYFMLVAQKAAHEPGPAADRQEGEHGRHC